MPAELLASRRDTTLILTLSNPGTGNALHPDICAAAIEVMSTAERDDSVRAVVITGADAVFCTGADLHHWLESRARDTADAAGILQNLQSWIEAIRDCPKPVIAAVEGRAEGAGFSLALACDLIVAGTTASFAMPSSQMGFISEGGGIWLLAQALPRQLASEILLDGKPVSANRLFELGLVNRLANDGAALDMSLDWAESLSERAPNALERIKSLLGMAPDTTQNQHFDLEKQAFLECLHHANALEGIQAVLQKRKPLYK